MLKPDAVRTGGRVPYLDFLRCFAIVLVMGLHVISPFLKKPELFGTRTWLLCVLCNELGRTGVPLFLMISGYLMLRDSRTADLAGFYRKRLARLLPPLLVWNLIYYLWHPGAEAGLSGFLTALLHQGTSYHMWYVYTLLGIYLLAPFLKRLVDACTPGQLTVLLVVIVFPGTLRTAFNSVSPVSMYLFEPLVENYVGYFLLGYLLGTARLEKRTVWAVGLGGIAGSLLGVWGNISTASPEAIPLPSNMGYSINHYLVASAVFVLCRMLFERGREVPSRAASVLTVLSDTVFGVYWVHALVLERVTVWLRSSADGMTLVLLLASMLALTAVISFAVMLVCRRVPVLRRLLM